VNTREIELSTGRDRLVDVTRQASGFAADNGGDGLLHLFLPHATAGLALIETGAGSDDDLLSAIDDLLPRDDRWRHAHGSPGHGADHVLPAWISPSLSIPVIGGALALGTWQSVIVVDPNVDNPRRRLLMSFLRSA
jgi:secondary thiamine-phosphate synthase enzyme